ncbi:hypothetical protein SAMN05192574_114106 [Mucilaginibacter gossypiicola]|uniref:Uncharacterized protein n=1 Tax=Mucilaginibacter gossypiicola TaxID=551995 RepID=A0A1H8T3Z0_9SPHI|nr:hypothetical protein SAMN05192574_114106 [Mucilaginibacter gossypiicola]
MLSKRDSRQFFNFSLELLKQVTYKIIKKGCHAEALEVWWAGSARDPLTDSGDRLLFNILFSVFFENSIK